MLMETVATSLIVSFILGIAVCSAWCGLSAKMQKKQEEKIKQRKRLLREAFVRRHLIERARKRKESMRKQTIDKTHDKQS